MMLEFYNPFIFKTYIAFTSSYSLQLTLTFALVNCLGIFSYVAHVCTPEAAIERPKHRANSTNKKEQFKRINA